MDKVKIWKKVLELIKPQISITNFRGWILQASLEDINEREVILKVPSVFIKDNLNIRYSKLIHQAITQVLGNDLLLNYKIDSSRPSQIISTDEEFFDFNPIQINPQIILNPKFNLENFVVGLTNNLAYAAAQAVVDNPGISYNPLFIYGQSGVGKTHLMQAIGNALLKKKSISQLVYAPSERFMNDFVDSIKTKRTVEFRKKYRFCDLLLIDDIQFISGKDSTQEEFFHTFNELQSKNTQIVLTSDRPPIEITKLESRLSSRFQGGLMVDMQLPDFDTRMAILKAKLEEKKENLPEEYLKAIAEVSQSNTRELEGKLIQVLQAYKLNILSKEDLIKKILGRNETQTTSLDFKKVLNIINHYFNIKPQDLIGPRRQKGVVLPRQIAMYLLYENCKIPYEQIGVVLGGRDHTTIMHGVDKIRVALDRDIEIQKMILEIKHQLNS